WLRSVLCVCVCVCVCVDKRLHVRECVISVGLEIFSFSISPISPLFSNTLSLYLTHNLPRLSVSPSSSPFTQTLPVLLSHTHSNRLTLWHTLYLSYSLAHTLLV